MRYNDSTLTVENLKIGSRLNTSGPLIQNVHFGLRKGRAIGLAGFSGSGKTITAGALCGLLPRSLTVLSGNMTLMGKTLDMRKPADFMDRRGRDIFMVFQSPSGALNPRIRVGDQIAETLVKIKGMDKRNAKNETKRLLALVNLHDGHYEAFPRQLSGGQRQRILLAIAFGLNPGVLIADEPTTGLDPESARRVIDLLNEIRIKKGVSLLLISHDLRTLSKAVDELLILSEGEQVEKGPVERLLRNPEHHATRELVEAMRYLES